MTSTSSQSQAPITSVIRFIDESGETQYGESVPNAAIGTALRTIAGDVYQPGSLSLTGQTAVVKRFLTPVDVSSIQCIGLNYHDHAKECGMKIPSKPILFYKNPASVLPHGEPIQIPRVCQSKDEVDFEAELGVVIGQRCKNVSVDDALNYVLGYVCCHDVSARDQQLNVAIGGGQWNRGKGFDTFSPFGPNIVFASAIADPNSLDIQFRLNGAVMQNSNTREMIFSVQQIVSFLSESTTLLPGTLIMTGTTWGVGFSRKPPVWLHPGDVCEVEIEKIGILKNAVENE